MWTGGVAIWKRSASVRPSAVIQCSTPWPIERCVWRTAFGKPVVPELNTSTASASGSAPCQSVMLCDNTGGSSSASVGSSGAASASVARPAASATASPGDTTAHACAISPAFHAGLHSTTAAPNCSAP